MDNDFVIILKCPSWRTPARSKVPAFVGSHDVLHEHTLGRFFKILIHGLSFSYAPGLVHLSFVRLSTFGWLQNKKNMSNNHYWHIHHFFVVYPFRRIHTIVVPAALVSPREPGASAGPCWLLWSKIGIPSHHGFQNGNGPMTWMMTGDIHIFRHLYLLL